MVVRFVRGSEKGLLSVSDVTFSTKALAVQAIRTAGARPGTRIIDNGVRVRLAYFIKQ